MYVAYVCSCSVFDYASMVWNPLLSQTNLQKLEALQNKVSEVYLNSPSTFGGPLEACYKAATAYQAKKYRRHTLDGPLYYKLALLTHQPD